MGCIICSKKDLEQEIYELQTVVTGHEEAVRVAKSESSALRAELDTTKDALVARGIDLVAARSEAERVTEVLEEVRGVLGKTRLEASGVANRLRVALAERDAFETRLGEETKVVEGLRTTAQESEASLAEAGEELRETKASVEGLSRENDSIQGMLQEARDREQRLRLAAKNEKKVHEDVCKALRDASSHSEARLAALEKKHNLLLTTARKLTEHLRAAKLGRRKMGRALKEEIQNNKRSRIAFGQLYHICTKRGAADELLRRIVPNPTPAHRRFSLALLRELRRVTEEAGTGNQGSSGDDENSDSDSDSDSDSESGVIDNLTDWFGSWFEDDDDGGAN